MIAGSGRLSLAVLGFVGCIYVAYTDLFPKQQVALGLGGLGFFAWCSSQGSLQGEAVERYGLFLVGAASLYLLVNGVRLVRRGRRIGERRIK